MSTISRYERSLYSRNKIISRKSLAALESRRMHLLGLQFAYVMVVRVGWLDDVVGSVIPGIDLNDLGGRCAVFSIG